MRESVNQLTSYIHEHIPITQHMGIKILSYDGQELKLSAPLQENINHRNSAFGGSISTIGILSGWTYLFLKLKEEGVKNKLVIQKSSIEFLDPVIGDFEAICNNQNHESWLRFIQTLTRKDKGRIKLKSDVISNNQKVAIHEGVFVALRI